MLKKSIKILSYTLMTLLMLVVLFLWLLSTERFQNYLTHKTTQYLSEKLKTKVEIKHVRLKFFNHFDIEGVYLETLQNDTLAYLGLVELNTTQVLSNLWNKETPIIKDVLIQDVFVNLKREDTTWNYDFIENAFASKTNNQKSDTTEKITVKPNTQASPMNDLPIDLKKLQCKNVKFYMDDRWMGTDMHFAIGDLLLELDKISLSTQKIDIKTVAINDADILIKEYARLKPKNTEPDDTTTWGTPFNPDLFQINLENFSIGQTQFVFQDGEINSKPGEFDESNLRIKNINASLKNTKILADTIFSDIESLHAEERSGLTVKNFKAKAKVSQVQAQLSEMLLETNHSILRDYYEMQYKNFHSFEDYISEVRMIAHLKTSEVSSLDIAYFANLLNEYPITLKMSGDVNGTVDSLAARNLHIQSMQSEFKGDAYAVGLPDIDNANFYADITKLHTSGNDLNRLVPQTKVDAIAWNEMKQIEYKGTYSGQVDAFYVNGKLNSTLGNAQFDLAMNFKGKIPAYNGAIQTDDFYLGKLIKQNGIGRVSVDGKVDGMGFELDELNSKLNATVKKIELDHKTYENLTINGIVSKKKFDGIFVAQDPQLKFNFDGNLDLSGKEPIMNFNSRILNIDLHKLGITQEPAKLSCLANLNFKGSSIDNFLGSANLRKIYLETTEKQIYVDSIFLNSFLTDDGKRLSLNSSIADAELKGKFNISELSNAFQLYLCHYLPQYIKEPKKKINEQFDFSVQIKEVEDLLNVFLPQIKNIDGTTISGALNTFNKKFSIDAHLPNLAYDQFKIKETYIVGAGDFTSFDVNMLASNFNYGDETIIPSFQINSSMSNDSVNLEILTQSINDVFGTTSIKAQASAKNNNLYVNLLPSNVNIKEDNWQLYSNGDMVFGKDIFINELKIENGAQQIKISSQNDNSQHIQATISELDLESLFNYAEVNQSKLYGRMSGTVDVQNFQTNPQIFANLNTTNEFIIDNDTIGFINVKGSFDVDKKIIHVDPVTSITRGVDKAYAQGNINLSDSTIHLSAIMNNTEIAFANQFIKDFVGNLKGKLTGQVRIDGYLNNPTITGNLNLKNGWLKIIMLGTSYELDDANLIFDNQKISISHVVLHDERGEEYKGALTGNITHKNFSDFYLNFNLKSEDFLCLNTREWDSDLFYGYLHAKLNLAIKGYLNDLKMDINAKPLDGSTFYLPMGSAGDASKFDYVKFREIGRSQTEDKNESSNYLKLTLNIEATPNVETIIVMDKNTGEEIRAKGNGDLKVIVDLGNDMMMYGNYEITEGVYLFKFRGIVNRSFIIDEGSKISWTGDAAAANIDVKAIYELPKPLALYPLVSATLDPNDKSEVAEAKRTYKTFVPLSLTGSLSSPNIHFDILQPDNRA
ncbi:MAG TPA: translocation/assembly module TamB domain-containing protein, partial [Chitinophagaceae bacterium]|nr:translocation/assembly module TamB domain-containing protein [Chitinophagaceae bacterium]